MLSQNAVRKRKNMTLPLVLHGVFPVVEAKLAEPLEREVRSVLAILRMLAASCLRLFLKFERFSSLKKWGGLQTDGRTGEPRTRGARKAIESCARCAFRHPRAMVWQPTVHHSRRIQ